MLQRPWEYNSKEFCVLNLSPYSGKYIFEFTGSQVMKWWKMREFLSLPFKRALQMDTMTALKTYRIQSSHTLWVWNYWHSTVYADTSEFHKEAVLLDTDCHIFTISFVNSALVLQRCALCTEYSSVYSAIWDIYSFSFSSWRVSQSPLNSGRHTFYCIEPHLCNL